MAANIIKRLVANYLERRRKRRASNIHFDFIVVLGLCLLLILPSVVTLRSVTTLRPKITDFSVHSTPFGYTRSLSLFLLPVLTLGLWQLRRKTSASQLKAFWWTTCFLTACGLILDFAFGLQFFCFDNAKATLGFNWSGFVPHSPWLQRKIPIEELVFYLSGILAILLIYIWGDEFWFAAYNPSDIARKYVDSDQIAQVHPSSIAIWMICMIVGFVYKFWVHQTPGWPGYFTFLSVIGLLPSFLFFPTANPFINWRAFSLSLFYIVLVSLFWEATLAVPYRWWDYQDRFMLGVPIYGFSGVPIEEPILWFSVTWSVVIVYETIYTFLLADPQSVKLGLRKKHRGF